MSTPLSQVLVWRNERVREWLVSVGFSGHSQNIHNSGIHGSLIACHSMFKCDEFATLLLLPKDKPEVTFFPFFSMKRNAPRR